MWIDSHAHITSLPDAEIEDVLARARDAKISHIVNVCTTVAELQHARALSDHYPWVINAGATTPHDVDERGEKDFDLFAQAALNGEIVAIGETGLDYASPHSTKKTQLDFLHRYLELAKKSKLPVIFHCRDAFDDLFAILKDYPDTRGVLHCFTGTQGDVHRAVERGFFLSLSGIITFKNATLLREVANAIPNDYLLIETDTPYLAPQSKRGKRNEPSYIIETAQAIADIKKASLEEISRITTLNAKRLFNLQ